MKIVYNLATMAICKGYSKAKWSKMDDLGVEIQNAKNMRKATLESHSSCLMQKRARKNTYLSKNENALKFGKNGHFAKAIVRQNGKKMADFGV